MHNRQNKTSASQSYLHHTSKHISESGPLQHHIAMREWLSLGCTNSFQNMVAQI